MKLTEKELNEFPIGTKIQLSDKRRLIRSMMLDTINNRFHWHELNTQTWYTNYGISDRNIEKIEIPTYTEYIPPKPILDEKEKEYLSYVIKPLRNIIKSIAKHYYKEEEYVYFYCSGIGNSFGLPYFPKGTMYKGMKLDREYTLEELGL